MMKRFAGLLSVAAVGLFSCGAFAAEGSASPSGQFSLPPVVARVNGVDISLQTFWEKMVGSAGAPVLTALIDDILVEQEGSRLFVPVKGNKKASAGAEKVQKEVKKRFDSFAAQFPDDKTFRESLAKAEVSEENIKKQIRLQVYKEMLIEDKTNVTEQEAKQYFDANKEKLGSPEAVHLKHILVSTEQEAKDLVLALKVGANFESLAKEKSLDKGTRERGGDLGFISKGMMAPEFEAKAFGLETGGTDIVPTPAGFHVIWASERRAEKKAMWDKETKSAVEGILKQAKFNQAYPLFVKDLRSKAQIEVLLNR